MNSRWNGLDASQRRTICDARFLELVSLVDALPAD
jgi:hypothetical protein